MAQALLAIDIAMVIDAMDMFHTEKFDAFALVSSDSDFAGLASRLRRGGKYVFGFGEDKTPNAFRNACDDFIVTSLLAAPPPTAEPRTPKMNTASLEDIDVIELLKSAASEYGDAEGWTLASYAGSMIKRQRPDFNPKSFGCRSFLQLVAKLSDRFELRRVPRGEGIVDEYRERREAN